MPVNTPNDFRDGRTKRAPAPRNTRSAASRRAKPNLELRSNVGRFTRVGYGFAVATALVVIALIASRHLGSAHALVHLVLLAIPVAAGLIVGGLWPATAATVVEAIIVPLTSLGSGGWLSRAEVVFVDVLVIAALHGFRKARAGRRNFVGLDAVLRAILDNDTTGIVVVNRSGRALFVSREAERICGQELRAGQGFEPLSSVRLAMADGKTIAVHDLFSGFEPQTSRHGGRNETSFASGLSLSGTRDLLVVRNNEQRTWIECQAVPVRIGARRAALMALLMWDSQTRHRQQMEASLDESLRKRREDRDAMLNQISRHLRESLDARHIQTVAAELLGAALHADRCFFLLFNVGEHDAVVGPQWIAPGVAPMAAEYEPVEIDVQRLYRRGLTRMSSDMRTSSLPTTIVSVFENRLGVRSAINVPFFEGDAASGALIVAMSDQPRAWSSDEVALAESVASQTRFVIEAARLLAGERARAEREELSNKIGNAVRSTIDPANIQFEATNELGTALEVDRCYYIQYDLESKKAAVGPDFARAPENLSLRGEYELPDDAAWKRDLIAARNTMVVEDATESDPLYAASVVTLKSETVRSFIRVAIFADRTPTAALIVAMTSKPRTWSADEVALVESVAWQTCSAITNALLIARETSRAQREQLLNQISVKVGQTQSALDAHNAAVRVLGLTLKADRCYLIQMEYYREAAVIAGEYHRADHAPMSASYPIEDPDLNWLLTRVRSGDPFIAADIRRKMPEPREKGTLLHAQPHRGLLAIPQLAGGQIDSILVLATSERPRSWTYEDVSLARDAARHMGGALHAALVQERERHIAYILQETLLPTLPSSLPGLDIAYHYKAALRESRIGGDFYDAFAVTPTKTILCVGDVSGKGLTAAAQLSSLRNMLRVLLYRGNVGVGEAVTELNQIVSQHRLMSGFATLCVGAYDGATRRFSYVSCGHEPAILLRSVAGSPVVLPTTSAAIGLYEGEQFEAGDVTMGQGDLLLLYTDGVSEAGRTTSGMLGTDGVAQIVVQAAMQGNTDCRSILSDIVARVELLSDGTQRDDMCLLLARAV
jgi:serine phosphatase RsbU (regulator of sigma subunit)/PAS domain-containing protein